MISKRSWRPPEFDESVPSASGTPRSSIMGSDRRPLPSIRLLAGLWTTVTPWRARRSASSGASHTPCATERRSLRTPARAISATVPPGHTAAPLTAWARVSDEMRVRVKSRVGGETAPHVDQPRRAALKRVRTEQDRDAAVTAPLTREIAIHAFGGGGLGARRGVERGADLGWKRELQEFVVEDVVHERRERDAHAARRVRGQRGLGKSRVREMIEARGDPVTDHLGGAEQDGQPNRLRAERPAVGHGVERPWLERQAVLGPFQHGAVGVIVRVDQAGHQDHPGGVDHLAGPGPACPAAHGPSGRPPRSSRPRRARRPRAARGPRRDGPAARWRCRRSTDPRPLRSSRQRRKPVALARAQRAACPTRRGFARPCSPPSRNARCRRRRSDR